MKYDITFTNDHSINSVFKDWATLISDENNEEIRYRQFTDKLFETHRAELIQYSKIRLPEEFV